MKNTAQAEKRRLALLVNLGGFESLTGKEQIQYIDDLGVQRGAKFLRENHLLIKADAPMPKSKFLLNKELIQFYAKRGFPIDKEMRFARKTDLREIDLREITITAEQFFQTHDMLWASSSYKIPKNVDFADCYLEDMRLFLLDFSDTNIRGMQLCQAKSISNCKLPKGIDFAGCSFVGMEIRWVDLSESNITGKQLCQAKYVIRCKLPKGIDFTACSFVVMEISGVDFSESNITGKQFCQAKETAYCKLPKGIDFTDCSFENKDIREINFRDSNITSAQVLQAQCTDGCIWPKEMDYGLSF